MNVLANPTFQIQGAPSATFDISIADVGIPGDAFAVEVNGDRLTPTSGNTGSNTRGTGATSFFSAVFDDVSIPNAMNTIEIYVTDSCCSGGVANIAFSNIQGTDTSPPSATSVSIASDNADPTLAMSGDTITLSLTFDEDLGAAPSVTIQGEAASVSGSGGSWTASLLVGASTTQGAANFEVSNIADTSGNAASSVTATTDGSAVSIDRTQPGLVIAGVPGTFLPGDVFNVSFEFGEAVTGFDGSDVAVTGGVAGTVSGGPQVYSATVTPDGTGNVTVAVADGAAQDGAGNPSTAASETALIDSAAVAGEMITEFMQARARNLVANQPRLSGFLSGSQGGKFSASVTQRLGEVDLHTGAGPVWFSLRGSQTEHDNGDESDYVLGTLGAHMELNQGLIVGGMLQFDYAADDRGGGMETSGQGWLAGPYVVAQIGEQPLFFEGRVLYGESDNDISPFGTFTDEFRTERWLALLALEGAYHAERFRYFPRLQLSHAVDKQKAYVDGLSNPVPEHTVRLSEISAGVDFEAPMFEGNDDHLLTWGISGIWSRLDGNAAASAYINEREGGRARLDLGYRYDNGAGLVMSTDIFVDGLGSGAYTSYGLGFGLAMEF